MRRPLSSNEDRPTQQTSPPVRFAWQVAGGSVSKGRVIDSMASPVMALAPTQEHSAVPGTTNTLGGRETVEQPEQTTAKASLGRGRSGGKRRRSPQLPKRFQLIVEGNIFKGAIMVSLFIALLTNPLVEICDIPDEPCNTIVNVIMLIVLVLFAAEVILSLLSRPSQYNPCEFFFWMDVLGTVSMIFEISWFGLSPVGKPMNETSSSSLEFVLLRTARFAKVGARVGRLHRGLKTFWAVVMHPGKAVRPDQQEMRKVSHLLMIALSTKVSVLTIVFVFFLPLFNIADFPVSDLSGDAWISRLEADYFRASEDARKNGGTSELFAQSVKEIQDFYAEENYKPWGIKGFPSTVTLGGTVLKIPGEFENVEPNRQQDIEYQTVEDCRVERLGCKGNEKASVSFDIGKPHRIESWLDIAMFVFIIIVMVVLSYDIQRSVNERVVEPLERMIAKVRDVASRFLKISVDRDKDADGDEYIVDAADQLSETDLLEAVISKLTKLTEIMVKEHVATTEEMAKMDHTTLGVLSTILRLPVGNMKAMSFARHSNKSSLGSQELAVTQMSMSQNLLESWELDVLELDNENLSNLVLYVFFDSKVGNLTGRSFTNLKIFEEFHEQARKAYNDKPYHCYQHACDVVHTMYRLLTLTSANTWLQDHEQYALLVAALCHDLGHFGLTNQFLVESKDELALGYNDSSPLENMHCAKLFGICNKEGSNIFANMGSDMQKAVRKFCISTILHTENVHHFELCMEIDSFGVRMSDACEEAAAAIADGHELPESYKEDVLSAKSSVWMNLFLHTCDVSNPLKPFPVCHKWAWRVLDEFFMQGDEEKRRGLPVGMLNDRDKVNRPGSQHGFINFLVAPLANHTVKLFPSLHELTLQMASNLQQWRNMWAEEVNPTAEEIAKKDNEIEKWRDVAVQLQKRVMPKTQRV